MSSKLKTSGCVTAIACFVFLTVFAPVSAMAADKTTWAKYNNNIPGASDSICTNGTIPLGTKGDVNAALYPAVIKDDSIYKMWYTGYDSDNTRRIYYATSSNGLTWTKYTNAVPGNTNTTSTLGRIPLGTSGGDTVLVGYPAVMKVGSFYKMWYAGMDGGKNRIYHATLDALPEGLIFYSY